MYPMPDPARFGRALACSLALCAFAAPLAARDAAVPAPSPDALRLIDQLGLESAPAPVRERDGWKRPERIVVARASPALLASLAAVAPGVELVALDPEAPLEPQLAQADGLMGDCSAELVAAAPRLRWIQLFSVGAEYCVSVPGLEDRGILLTNMQRTSAPPIAEHAIAMLLSLARGLPHYGRAQAEQRWARGDRGEVDMREVGGRTMLVVGLGGIGTEVARRAHALGMTVIAIRNSRREGPDFVAEVGLPEDLLAFAARADAVVSALPLTPETTGIFDARFFATLPRGAWFINVGRGASVVTDELVAALDSGQLAGAGLDVTEPEPLPPGHPLWKQPNVVITPHVSTTSDAQSPRTRAILAENLRRYVAGEPMLNVVDIARGY